MIIALISVIAVASVITIAEFIRIRKLEAYVTQLVLDVEMLVQNNNSIDK